MVGDVDKEKEEEAVDEEGNGNKKWDGFESSLIVVWTHFVKRGRKKKERISSPGRLLVGYTSWAK